MKSISLKVGIMQDLKCFIPAIFIAILTVFFVYFYDALFCGSKVILHGHGVISGKTFYRVLSKNGVP